MPNRRLVRSSKRVSLKSPNLIPLLERSVPSDSFIYYYIEWCNELETARIFDLLSALWLLSTTIGCNVKLARGHQLLPLNLYVLFIAESGVARKSTAIGVASNVYAAYCQRRGIDQARIDRGTSPEAARKLIDSSNGRGTFISSELVTLFGRTGYTHLLPSMLTDLYDGAPSRQMSIDNESKHRLQSPYVTLLAASAPSWFVRAINPDVIEGGFASRCLTVSVDRGKGLRPFPNPSISESEFVDGCCERLWNSLGQEWTTGVCVGDAGRTRQATWSTSRQISRRTNKCNSGREKGNGAEHAWSERSILSFATSGREAYEQWYRDLHDEPTGSGYEASFNSRAADHLCKLAALLCINRKAQRIERDDIISADGVLAFCRESGIQVFGSNSQAHIQDDKHTNALDRVLFSLRDTFCVAGVEWTSQSDLTKSFSKQVSAGGLRNILDIMHDLQMVQCYTEGIGQRRGRPSLNWRGTTKLLEVDLAVVARRVDRSRI